MKIMESLVFSIDDKKYIFLLYIIYIYQIFINLKLDILLTVTHLLLLKASKLENFYFYVALILILARKIAKHHAVVLVAILK